MHEWRSVIYEGNGGARLLPGDVVWSWPHRLCEHGDTIQPQLQPVAPHRASARRRYVAYDATRFGCERIVAAFAMLMLGRADERLLREKRVPPRGWNLLNVQTAPNGRSILQQKLESGHKRWQDLSRALELVQEQMDLETRADERLRLQGVVERSASEREEIERQLQELQREWDAAGRQDLVRDALRMERNRAFAEAAKLWEQVRTADPLDTQAEGEIERLLERQRRSDALATFVRRLSQRIVEIKPVFARVTRTLQRLSSVDAAEDAPALAVIESFLAEQLTAAEFVELWQELESDALEPEESDIDFRALAHRLGRGEIVLFLGSNVPHLSDAQVPDPGHIVIELASEAHLAGHDGSLSAVAEYYQIRPEYGRRSLEARLRDLLPNGPSQPALYQMLAGIREPLVLISSAYDFLLENAFREADKKFVLVSAHTGNGSAPDPGKVLVRYSDRDRAEPPCLEQDLSRHRLLESDYSLIYKIRGYCPVAAGTEGERPELTVSEANYFAFARHADKMIPSYVSKQFIGRGLLFMGYAPAHWEDRLIADAVLERRLSSAEPSSVVDGGNDRFTNAYWESRSVRRHSLALNAFVAKLQEHL